jgi:hypothetical protein
MSSGRRESVKKEAGDWGLTRRVNLLIQNVATHVDKAEMVMLN